ncbi:MAG: TetR/AcrR family transcriptional regulator [Deltaproteobacteria bacterium]|nr:TetR/AcrR family transcriptional regulator [Deltaproteobacteria bacterium]
MRSGAQGQALRPPVSSSKRDAVLRAALELFAERTFGATPVPDIACRAQVGAGTVYRYFAGKEELANVLFRQCKGTMREALREALAGSTDAREQFRLLWRGLSRFAVEQPQMMRFLEMQHHDDYLDSKSRAVSTELFEAAERFVREGQRAGTIRAGSPGVLIALVFGAFVGMIKESEQGRFELTARTIEQAGETAWRMLEML